MSNKQAALEAVNHLPEDATFEDILEEIAILAGLRRGREDIQAGRVLSHEEVTTRIRAWISK